MEGDYIVQTEYGKIKGAPYTSFLNVPYIRFLGIPYATPPIGSLRFKSPLRLQSWGDNVLDASEEASPCAAKNVFTKTFVGTDDCLYLNIYTKNLKPQKLAAVMVYIHGGGHCSGSGTQELYSPDYLLLADVVVVTINFRLGPLGFLSLKDQSLNVPGNAAMKDQQLALKFVRDNIRNFGGDPNNCTLFGHSSGGTSVSLHCVAESSRGLFHKAIIMSGSHVAKEALIRDDNYASKLAQKLGYDGRSESEMLTFLENANVISLAEAQYELIESAEAKFAPMPFGPCVEPYESDSSFLLEPPIDLLSSAWSKNVDVMIGGTADEGLFIRPELETDRDYKSIIPDELKLVLADGKLDEFAARLKTFYLSLFPTDYEAFIRGDKSRWLCMNRFIHTRQHSNGSGQTFLYRFSVDSPTQNHYRNRWLGLGVNGVVHADELCYVWKSKQGDVPDRNSIEFLSVMRFTSLLASFAIAGDPNANVLEVDLNSVVWKPVESTPYKGLDIDKVLEFKVLEQSKRLEFLESLYKEASVRLF